MIDASLIMGAVLSTGKSLWDKFWNAITCKIREVMAKVSEVIHTAVLGVKVFLRKTSDGVMHITKNYSQNAETKRWKETVVKQTLNEDEIPMKMRKRLMMDEEFDISDEYENFLQHGLSM